MCSIEAVTSSVGVCVCVCVSVCWQRFQHWPAHSVGVYWSRHQRLLSCQWHWSAASTSHWRFVQMHSAHSQPPYLLHLALPSFESVLHIFVLWIYHGAVVGIVSTILLETTRCYDIFIDLLQQLWCCKWCCVSVCHIGSNLSGVYRMQLAPGHYVFVQTKSKLFKNSASGHPEFIMSTHSIVRCVLPLHSSFMWRNVLLTRWTKMSNVIYKLIMNTQHS